MTLNSWRALALFTSLGWAASLVVLLWPQSSVPVVERDVRSAGAHLKSAARPPARRRSVPHRRLGRAPGPPASADLDQLRDEVRNEVLDEIELERAERRQERSERHLTRLLDEVAAFAQQHDLDAETVATLESSMGTMHDRLEELRPPGPPGPGGPPPEVLEQLEAAFGQFQDEVGEVLQDDELADEFTERMTPRPLRDRRR